MTSIALSIKKSIKHKTASVQMPRLNWKLVYSFGILMLFLMILSYIYLINNLTGGVYQIKTYNKEINRLTAENKNLETEFAKIDYLASINDRARALSFEKTREITYIQIAENALAAK